MRFVRSKGARALTTLIVAGSLAACRHGVSPVEAEGQRSLQLVSSSLPGGRFAVAFTCDGADRSPELEWSSPPNGTVSLALLLYDRDTPGSGFVHWLLLNIPPKTRALPESSSFHPEELNGALQGLNDFGRTGYGGPCPPSGTHHYVFDLFALDTRVRLPARATRAQWDQAIHGHVLARGTLEASYKR